MNKQDLLNVKEMIEELQTFEEFRGMSLFPELMRFEQVLEGGQDVNLLADVKMNEINNDMLSYIAKIKPLKNEEKVSHVEQLEKLLLRASGYNRIYILSVLLNVTEDSQYFEQLMDACLDGTIKHAYEKHYILNQATVFYFSNVACRSFSATKKMYQVYNEIVDWYAENYYMYCQPISKEDRNHNLVLVITRQFLGMGHGPTKTVADTCRSLIKDMGKEVMLVNTADFINALGTVPYIDPKLGSYADDYNSIARFNYLDISFNYIQFKNQNLNFIDIRKILNWINVNKPGFIIDLGGANIVAELCNKIVPVITMSLNNLWLPLASTCIMTTNKKIDDMDIEILKIIDRPMESVIQSVLTDTSTHFTEFIRIAAQSPLFF